ncbi:MAG: 2Fe-2S iron-sulfur cluster-binding protein [Termitinemataceae bacterium]|nr:MAG: 2Fe-2S iron-sulfur cluster-binding protein [Termitinemataceae bacterium]
MTIGFTLNGENVVTQAGADHRLIDILRSEFNLTGAKCGCLSGLCGSCLVIFNGNIVPSCMVPAFSVRDSDILTIEGFAKTPEYKDIIQGFELASVKNCGYCDAGKILSAEKIVSCFLSQNIKPKKDEIVLAFQNIKCRCTVLSNLVDGVFQAMQIRERRLQNERI